MDKINQFLKWLGKFKFFLALGIFLVIIISIDENSLYNRHLRHLSIANYKQEIAKYQAQYAKETALLNMIDTSHFAVEKIARERYLMQRPNEDVFIITEE